MSDFTSPVLNTTSQGCLAFSAHGQLRARRHSSQLSVISIGMNGQNETVHFPNLLGPAWIPLQVNISEGISRIIFNSTVPGDEGFLAIDDIKLLPGHCPLPGNSFL